MKKMLVGQLGTRSILLLALAILSGCGAHSPRVLSEEYQSIHISAFKNQSMQFGLTEPMTHIMIDQFIRDGRLRVTTKEQADLEMDTVISEVLVSPVAFSDLDRAVGYTMSVTILVTVYDTDTGVPLMKDQPFTASGTFLLHNEPTLARTQDVSLTLAENVVSRLIEDW